MNWTNELNCRILIVDDSIDNLELLLDTLKNSLPESTVYQTNNASDAFKIAKDMTPDLIISDWDMPHKTGIDLIYDLKLEELTNKIPVIMLTGVNCDPVHLKKALDTGAVDYIKKPFETVELLARIHSALAIKNEHTSSINSKENELIQGALNLEKSHEFLGKLKTKLKLFSDSATLRKKDQAQIDEILELIEDRTSMDNWKQFELVFKSVHPNFIKKVLLDYPDLSMSDLKLCSLIRLNMSIKNIAYILHQKPESIKVSRSRLRKKLGLEHSQNLSSFLSQY